MYGIQNQQRNEEKDNKNGFKKSASAVSKILNLPPRAYFCILENIALFQGDFKIAMQIRNFTQLGSVFKQEVHDFPNRHISSISLSILTCNIRFENGLRGRILW